MSKYRSKHAKCHVVDCKSQHKCLFSLPASGERRSQWIDFIYNGDVPVASAAPYVCANHFNTDSFANEGQYSAGFASRLLLKEGAIPTIRDLAEVPLASNSLTVQAVKDVGCQTDPRATASVGTQLSWSTMRPHFRSTGTQTKAVSKVDVRVGTSTTFAPEPQRSSTPGVEVMIEEEEDEGEAEDEEDPGEGTSCKEAPEKHDPTYCPEEDMSVSTGSSVISDAPTLIQETPKYIVYESCLLELFENCPVCQRVCYVTKSRIGTFLSVKQQCPHCEFQRQWSSQPLVGSTPAGNLQLSAAVYFNGASFFKLERIFRAMHLKFFQYDTFRRHARTFLEPAIVHKWRMEQDALFQRLSQDQSVVAGGDMRAHSPGDGAKYGSYTLMDLKRNTVIDVQLVQSNEVGGSCHMEKEGLKRSLALLEERGVTLDCIVTDRHLQIQKFLRERNIVQYYDVRHIEKGLSKKLAKISKKKECEPLKKWTRTIKNHVYWTAASSSSGPERVAKWTSILNHVQDKHTHDDPEFPKCLHPERATREKSKWLRAGTPAFYKLEKTLTNKRILKDVAQLSPHHQTSSLEAFHRLICRFAPKNVVFPFIGLLCRLYLSAMHFNENADRPQKTFNYMQDLMDLVFDQVFLDPAPFQERLLEIPVPEDLQFDTPAEEDVNASYVSRLM